MTTKIKDPQITKTQKKIERLPKKSKIVKKGTLSQNPKTPFGVKLLYTTGPQNQKIGARKSLIHRLSDFLGIGKEESPEKIITQPQQSKEVAGGSFCPVKIPEHYASAMPHKYMMRLDLSQKQLIEIVDLILMKKEPIDPFNPHSHMMNLIEKNYGIGKHAITHMLDIMTQCGILEKKIEGKIPTCPNDSAYEFSNKYACPFCNHRNFEIGETYEHLHCGHIDFSTRYWNNTCPKCNEKLSQLGVDYIKTDSHFKCFNCNEFFGEPLMHLECQRCKRKFDLDKLNWRDSYIYIPATIRKKDEEIICKSCFTRKIESMYQLKLPKFPDNETDVIIFPKEDYPRIIEQYLKEINKGKRKCLYISLNKTCAELNDMLQKHKLSFKNFEIIDCISLDFKEKIKKNKACTFISTKNDLKNLAKLIKIKINQIKKNKADSPLVLIDSCSTLLAYHHFEIVNAFIHHLIIDLKQAEIGSIMLTIEEASQEQYLAQLIQYSDHFYEL
jgi:hypothetical protein